MNSVNLVGRLTRDPELRVTTNGKSVCEFSLAVTKRFKTEGQPDADFFRIKAWGPTADYVNNYLTKGRLCSVSGRIDQRRYTDKDGNAREVFEVIADQVNGLDRPRDDNGHQPDPPHAGHVPDPPAPDDYDPWLDE